MENDKRYTITLDDDPSVARLIARATGIASLPYASSAALMGRSVQLDPVAVFVDVHLGVGESGLDVLPDLRARWTFVPIIVVTSDVDDLLVGQALAAGANDFIRKPISPSELNGRLHARIAEMRLRSGKDMFRIGDFEFCMSRSVLQKNDKAAYLPALEARLLVALIESRDMVVSRSEIKRLLWGRLVVSDNTLDKKISSLRKALSHVGSSASLKAIYGQGVMLQSSDIEKLSA